MATKKAAIPVPDAIVAAFAVELEEYRLGGCPTGGAEDIRGRIRKVASRHRQSFSDLWARVHAEAYERIDADPRLRLRGDGGRA